MLTREEILDRLDEIENAIIPKYQQASKAALNSNLGNAERHVAITDHNYLISKLIEIKRMRDMAGQNTLATYFLSNPTKLSEAELSLMEGDSSRLISSLNDDLLSLQTNLKSHGLEGRGIDDQAAYLSNESPVDQQIRQLCSDITDAIRRVNSVMTDNMNLPLPGQSSDTVASIRLPLDYKAGEHLVEQLNKIRRSKNTDVNKLQLMQSALNAAQVVYENAVKEKAIEGILLPYQSKISVANANFNFTVEPDKSPEERTASREIGITDKKQVRQLKAEIKKAKTVHDKAKKNISNEQLTVVMEGVRKKDNSTLPDIIKAASMNIEKSLSRSKSEVAQTAELEKMKIFKESFLRLNSMFKAVKESKPVARIVDTAKSTITRKRR